MNLIDISMALSVLKRKNLMPFHQEHSNSGSKIAEDMCLTSSIIIGMTELILIVFMKANAFQYQSQGTYQILTSGDK